MERRADYLTYYNIAKTECEELMARRDQHTLNPNYENIWRNVTSFVYDPQGEIIWEIGAGGGNSNSDSRMGNYDGPNLNNASRYGAGGYYGTYPGRYYRGNRGSYGRQPVIIQKPQQQRPSREELNRSKQDTRKRVLGN